MIDLDMITDVPWGNADVGHYVSLDGAEAGPFQRDDIARLVAYGDSDGGQQSSWDGESAGIVELKDGRFVSWESWWGPTGSGFCHDAYGGDADVFFARTEETARMHLSERARELFR